MDNSREYAQPVRIVKKKKKNFPIPKVSFFENRASWGTTKFSYFSST